MSWRKPKKDAAKPKRAFRNPVNFNLYFCDACDYYVEIKNFTPSSITNCIRLCKPCRYKRYNKHLHDNMYKKCSRALYAREHKRTKTRTLTIKPDVIERKFNSANNTCSITKDRLGHEFLTLERSDMALPFDITTNCTVIAKSIVIKRSQDNERARHVQIRADRAKAHARKLAYASSR